MTLKHLCVQFDTPLQAYQIPLFRGAIVEKVGRENDLFHNHFSDTKFIHRYPIVQYKRLKGLPAIVCLGAGVEAIHLLFAQQDWTLQIAQQTYAMKIHHLELKQFEMQTNTKMSAYTITDWIALNQQNYPLFKALPTEAEQIAFLQNILIGNILGFAEGIGWHIEEDIVVRINPEIRANTVQIKNQKLIGFNFTFMTNAFLPHLIGLGGKAALGYGIVRGVRQARD